jgi:hypothetical protein
MPYVSIPSFAASIANPGLGELQGGLESAAWRDPDVGLNTYQFPIGLTVGVDGAVLRDEH